jgi:hypothetical protein
MTTQMTTADAIDIVQSIGTQFGVDLLEVLTYMRDNLNDFSQKEKRASLIVLADMTKLFA